MSNIKLCKLTHEEENGFCENQVGGRKRICVYVFVQFPESLDFSQMIDYLCHD